MWEDERFVSIDQCMRDVQCGSRSYLVEDNEIDSPALAMAVRTHLEQER